MATTYWDYIRVEDLLALQGGNERDEARLSNHEVLFITVHQVFELWFKLVLRELEALRATFRQDPVPEADLAQAVQGLARATRIFEVAAQHFTVMETLGTRDYLDFRDKLYPASGFQSAQLREMEILLGLTDEERVGLGAKGAWKEALKSPDGAPSPALARVERRLGEGPTLKDGVEAWLLRTPIAGFEPGDAGDEAAVEAFLGAYLDALQRASGQAVQRIVAARAGRPETVARRHQEEVEAARAFFLDADPRRRRIRAAILFIESYRELPLLSWPREVLQALLAFDQALVIWRQRHARMVERVIGRRVGTGGSSGVEYLDQSANAYRIFGDLWAVRTVLVGREWLPPLADPRPYGFARDL